MVGGGRVILAIGMGISLLSVLVAIYAALVLDAFDTWADWVVMVFVVGVVIMIAGAIIDWEFITERRM